MMQLSTIQKIKEEYDNRGEQYVVPSDDSERQLDQTIHEKHDPRFEDCGYLKVKINMKKAYSRIPIYTHRVLLFGFIGIWAI